MGQEKKLSLERRILHIIIGLACIIAVGWYFQDIVTYLVIALMLSAILRTPTNHLANIQFLGVKMPRTIAILISFHLLFSIVALFIYLFVPLVSEQIKVISTINSRDLSDLFDKLDTPLTNIEKFLINTQLTSKPFGFLKGDIIKRFSEFLSKVLSGGLVNNLLQTTGNFFVGLIAVIFITFFFLYDSGLFRKFMISSIPNKYFEVSIAAFNKTEHLLSNYLLGLFVQMISIFSIASVGLLIAGVEYAVTIAVFAAIANLIPFLGPIIGGMFGLIIGLSTNAATLEWDALLVLGVKIISVFGVVQLSDNIFLQPVIFSKSVKTHPLVIFLAVFVGAGLGGVVGMILAIPTFTIIRVIFTEFYKGYKQYYIFRD